MLTQFVCVASEPPSAAAAYTGYRWFDLTRQEMNPSASTAFLSEQEILIRDSARHAAQGILLMLGHRHGQGEVVAQVQRHGLDQDGLVALQSLELA